MDRDVRRIALGRGRVFRKGLKLRQGLPAAGAHVEQRSCVAQVWQHMTGLSPRQRRHNQTIRFRDVPEIPAREGPLGIGDELIEEFEVLGAGISLIRCFSRDERHGLVREDGVNRQFSAKHLDIATQSR